MRRPFGRNFIKENWNYLKKPEERLWLNRKIQTNQCIPNHGVCIEEPPVFLNGQPEHNAEIGDCPKACLATGYAWFDRVKTIRLADEGLTDEIMDNVHPTLSINELVANRQGCTSKYQMLCELTKTIQMSEDQVLLFGEQSFQRWEAERWHHLAIEFYGYPPGMRYLTVRIRGRGSRQDMVLMRCTHGGVKMARLRVEAFCEPHKDEEGDDKEEEGKAK